MTENRFDKRLKMVSADVLTKIARIDELKGRWMASAQLGPQVLGRLKKSVLVTSTGASTRIEGSKLSDKEIERLIKGLSVQKFKDRDKQEVKGYYELLENIFVSWKRVSITDSSIKHLHKELLKYVEKDKLHRGEYKKKENKVEMIDDTGKTIEILFEPTQPYLTPKEMQELVEWTVKALADSIYHPILITGNFVVEFLAIHPFQDGNGRLSRILINLMLLKSGYTYAPYVSHEKIIEDNKSDYYIALRKSQKTFKTKLEDMTPWINFFLDALLKQSQMAIELLTKENVERILSPKQLDVWQYLQMVEEATPMEISKKTNVARPTVNQVLEKLLELNKIERIGLGRATRYRKKQ